MIDVVIPVYKPDGKFDILLGRLLRQTVMPSNIILMYTRMGASEKELADFTAHVEEIKASYEGASDVLINIYPVNKRNFSHGMTRNEGIAYGHNPYILMMTQDALPADTRMIENLLTGITQSEEISQCYARQISDNDAPDYIRLNQNFNYPPESRLKGSEDYEKLGIKTIFCSDVCCMYRRDVFEYIGGFEDVIFNEDMLFARKAIDAGFKILYAANARVIHYHRYSCRQQRKRNFDLAVSQKQHPEAFSDLSSVGEGRRLVLYVLGRLLKRGHILQFFYCIFWSMSKFIGYRLGRSYRILPKFLCRRLSATPSYWG